MHKQAIQTPGFPGVSAVVVGYGTELKTRKSVYY